MTVAELLKRVDKLAKQSGRSPKTISMKIFKDSKRIEALRGGARIWPETLRHAAQELRALERALKEKA